MKKSLLVLVVLLACCLGQADVNDVNNPILLPFVGNEVQLVEVKAYPENYINKTFEVIGVAGITDYYNCKYENAKNTHVSLAFDELRPDKSYTGECIYLYVKKNISKSLTDAIIKEVKAGYKSKLVRVKITILSERYNSICGEQAELINYQFRSDDKSKWLDWSANNEPNNKQKRIIPSFDPNNGIVYNGKKRSKRWFYQIYKGFYDKIAVVDGEYEYVEGKLIIDKNKQTKIVCSERLCETSDGHRYYDTPTFDPLSKNQFADAINNGFIFKRKVIINGETVLKEIP